MIRPASIIGTVAAVAFLLAAGAYAEGEVTIARKVTAGQALRYKVTQKADVMGAQADVALSFQRTIKTLRPDGGWVQEEQNEGGKVTIGGMEMDIPAGAGPILTFGKSGNVLKFDRPAGYQAIFSPQVDEALADLVNPALPDKAVPVGAAWTTTYEDPANAGKKLEVKTTYAGKEKLDGKDALKLTQTGGTTVEAQNLQVQVTFWLDPETGTAWKSEATVRSLPTQFGVMNLTTTATLVPTAK